jgi:hypothetical protein
LVVVGNLLHVWEVQERFGKIIEGGRRDVVIGWHRFFSLWWWGRIVVGCGLLLGDGARARCGCSRGSGLEEESGKEHGGECERGVESWFG